MTDQRNPPDIIQKSAFVAVIGRPSSGKSTLLNTLCGAKISIVSPLPQTTRNSIRGIVNRPQGQLVFVDTPGLHISEKKLNRRLQLAAGRTITESDLVLYLLDALRKPGDEEYAASAQIKTLGVSIEKIIVAVNKKDLKSACFKTALEFLKEVFPQLPPENIFFISALTGEGTEDMLNALFCAAPEDRPYYDSEYYTDQDVHFRIAEIIREKCINKLRDELPYCIHVEVADAELRAGTPGTLWVRAFILTERESQKGIVVGSGGKMIKNIRLAALKDLRDIFDWKVELDLRVKTSPGWRQNDAILKRFV